MNKQNISKMKFFFLGLENKFNENSDLFKDIKVTYKTGLKSFKGVGTFNNGKISYNFNGITSKNGAHFILKIDNILIKPKQYDAIISGVKSSAFPSIPVDSVICVEIEVISNSAKVFNSPS